MAREVFKCQMGSTPTSDHTRVPDARQHLLSHKNAPRGLDGLSDQERVCFVADITVKEVWLTSLHWEASVGMDGTTLL